MANFWYDDDDIKVDGSGNIIECSVCPCLDACDKCNTDTTPYKIQIDFASVVDSGCDCNAAFNNQTFVLTQRTADDCQWDLVIDECSLYDVMTAVVSRVQISSNWFMRFRLLVAVGISTRAEFRLDVAIADGSATIDCSANRSLPFDSEGGTNQCDWSGGTVTWTPL